MNFGNIDIIFGNNSRTSEKTVLADVENFGNNAVIFGNKNQNFGNSREKVTGQIHMNGEGRIQTFKIFKDSGLSEAMLEG